MTADRRREAARELMRARWADPDTADRMRANLALGRKGHPVVDPTPPPRVVEPVERVEPVAVAAVEHRVVAVKLRPPRRVKPVAVADPAPRRRLGRSILEGTPADLVDRILGRR